MVISKPGQLTDKLYNYGDVPAEIKRINSASGISACRVTFLVFLLGDSFFQYEIG